ncbi:hypothetical protein SAY87_010266 [Trapa incisa]|uniref:Cytochrome b561 and DOMON domain-containing protein n=1 Tax=Trapa incisa TaxID=236973 RepID=A0AAN7GTV6_9MYRT|nr:hypothetical protein SAY87_010266 [Trapa incisa]
MARGIIRTPLLGLYLYALLLSSWMMLLSCNAQDNCSKYKFSSNQVFSSCSDLPYLNAFLHWNYDTSTGKVQLAYRHISVDTSKWVAWAINPTSTGMAGSQALVAYQLSDGSIRAYTSPITRTSGTTLAEGALSFDVSDISATYASGEMIIFATITPPGNSTTVNQVWQDGPIASGGTPGQHPLSGSNVQSSGSINFASGLAAAGGGSSRTRRKNIHGVLNAVSWGVLMPVGVIAARYLKVFKSGDPAWFYLHVTCQSSAYIVGVVGWATGLKLGSESKGITYTTHRIIGIILFCLATLQVFALLMRPNKDHKNRKYWNVYHHMVGYSVIILSCINIFKGFDALNNPHKKWKRAYMGVLISLGVNFLWLEAYTWFIVLKRQESSQEGGTGKVSYGYGNGNGQETGADHGSNGFGYGSRPHYDA